jgi:hypothetical protein
VKTTCDITSVAAPISHANCKISSRVSARVASIWARPDNKRAIPFGRYDKSGICIACIIYQGRILLNGNGAARCNIGCEVDRSASAC